MDGPFRVACGVSTTHKLSFQRNLRGHKKLLTFAEMWQ